jgi:hypothetical protein
MSYIGCIGLDLRVRIPKIPVIQMHKRSQLNASFDVLERHRGQKLDNLSLRDVSSFELCALLQSMN